MSNTTFAPTSEFARVYANIQDVQLHRALAVEASGQVDKANRVAHAANVEYAKHLCTWAHDEVDSNVLWFDLTMDELRKAQPEIFAEAQAFRDAYVSTNISVIWKRIRETARKYAEANSLYGLTPNMLGDVDGTDGADGDAVGEGSVLRSAREVIESAEKNGGVWLFRNLERRERMTMSEHEFKSGLYDLLVAFGLTDEEIRGNV